MQIHAAQYRAGAWSPALPVVGAGTLLGFAFGGVAFGDDPTPFLELRRRYPGITLVGCSSSGEIFGDEVADDTVSVALLAFDHTTVRAVAAPIDDPAQSAAVGAQLGSRLTDPGLAGVIVLSDGLRVNGSMLAAGLGSQLHEGVVIAGGLAGDGDRFERTWTLVDGRPAYGQVSALGLYGDAVRLGHGSAGGWQQFGPRRHITRADANVLYELDGRPALELYKTYLGDRANGLPATALLFPLLVQDDTGTALVRTILGINEDDQSMVFAGDVPQGATAQLMRASLDSLIDGAEDAAAKLDHEARGQRLCLAISCVGRRMVLGEDCEEETAATLRMQQAGTTQIGFYSYGELGPTDTARCDLHNQTMTLTTISEAAS